MLIKYQTIQKWDGKLPSVMAGTGDSLLINIPVTE